MNSSNRPIEVRIGIDSTGAGYVEFGNNPTHTPVVGLMVSSLASVIVKSRITESEVEDFGVFVAGLLADNVSMLLQAERDNRADT